MTYLLNFLSYDYCGDGRRELGGSCPASDGLPGRHCWEGRRFCKCLIRTIDTLLKLYSRMIPWVFMSFNYFLLNVVNNIQLYYNKIVVLILMDN